MLTNFLTTVSYFSYVIFLYVLLTWFFLGLDYDTIVDDAFKNIDMKPEKREKMSSMISEIIGGLFEFNISGAFL